MVVKAFLLWQVERAFEVHYVYVVLYHLNLIDAVFIAL